MDESTLQAICAQVKLNLSHKNVDATKHFEVHIEWPGTIDVMFVPAPGQLARICYGTANQTWNGDVYIRADIDNEYVEDEYVEDEQTQALAYTPIPSDSTNVEIIALAISTQSRLIALHMEGRFK